MTNSANPKKVLIYAAGVLGTYYAVLLHDAGHEVTLVARGARLAHLQEHGIQLAEADSPIVRTVHVPVIETATGAYDLVLVQVRAGQVAAVLESLHSVEGDVLFLVNWAGGFAPLADVIGADRVILGAPTTGGVMDGQIVRYRAASPLSRLITMAIGESGPRYESIRELFAPTGIRTRTQPNMETWLATHAAFQVPLSLAVTKAGGTKALAADREGIRAMVREYRTVLPAKPVPSALGLLRIAPGWLLMALFRRMLLSSVSDPLNTDTPAVSGEMQLTLQQLAAAR